MVTSFSKNYLWLAVRGRSTPLSKASDQYDNVLQARLGRLGCHLSGQLCVASTVRQGHRDRGRPSRSTQVLGTWCSRGVMCFIEVMTLVVTARWGVAFRSVGGCFADDVEAAIAPRISPLVVLRSHGRSRWFGRCPTCITIDHGGRRCESVHANPAIPCEPHRSGNSIQGHTTERLELRVDRRRYCRGHESFMGRNQ
jgi:hypothetical protein